MARRFEIVVVAATKEVDVSREVDIRFLLLALSARVADHLRRCIPAGQRAYMLAGEEEGLIAEWIRVLGADHDGRPSNVQARATRITADGAPKRSRVQLSSLADIQPQPAREARAVGAGLQPS